MKTTLGIILIILPLAIPLIALAIIAIKAYGFWNIVMILGLLIIMTTCIISGFALLKDKKINGDEMSHSIEVRLIADHEIELLGNMINIHDLKTIMLNSYGKIIAYVKHNGEWIHLLEDEKVEGK
jgi:hypothetical protein